MRLKNFTGNTFSFYKMGLFLLLFASFYACKKDKVEGPPTSLTEMGSGITIEHADTSLVLKWNRGLIAWEGNSRQPELSYEVQVSTDSTFSDQNQSVLDMETDSLWIFLGDEEIVPLQKHFARVRTVSSSGTGASGWTRTPSFQLRPIDLFRPIKVWNLTDEAAILGWARHGELTTLIVETAEGTEKQQFDVTDEKLVSQLLEGLTSGKAYVAKLFRGDNRPLGVLNFMTKPSVENMEAVDLRASADPMILQNTLKTVPDGSVIVLKRGMTYTMGSFTLDRGVTLVSEPGFGPQATIDMQSSFNVEGTIDLIKFEDVNVTGDIGGSYVFNISKEATVNKIEFEACRISELRGVMRLQSAGPKTIKEYVINNSIVQNIGNYNALTVDHNDATIRDVRFTNSTFINLQWIIRHGGGIKPTLNAVLFENLTLYHSPWDNRYIIDAGTGELGSLTVRNTLIGYTSGARSFNSRMPSSITVSNSFATSDAKWGTSNTQKMIEGVVAYDGVSEEVFAAPDKTNFSNSDLTITDEALFTVGDPRWRP